MTAPKVIDLDALLELVGTDSPVETKQIKLLGREWSIICDVNSFALTNTMSGDVSSMMTLLQSIIVEDQWTEFVKVAANHPALRGEEGAKVLMNIITKLIESVSERPTTPPSPSRRSGGNPKSVRKSAANSSLRVATRTR